MAPTKKENGIMLSIFTLLYYFVIIHKLHKLGEKSPVPSLFDMSTHCSC